MENDGGALRQTGIRLLEDLPRVGVADRLILPAIGIVRGREAVTAMQPMLVELSRRTGQSGAMDWLSYFVSSPDSLEKIPYLLLVGYGPEGSLDVNSVTAAEVLGAVLIYEYRFGRMGTKVFSTDDTEGIRTVIAPNEFRIKVADIALRRLMRLGAVTAMISVDGGTESRRGPLSNEYSPFKFAMRTRTLPHHLMLEGTYDDTLGTMGQHTRRNFRYYRRRAEKELGATFIPQVEMDREEFLEMNRRSTNPIEKAVAEWRYSLRERTVVPENIVFVGLRGLDGQWLSLVGGRRHGQTTEIDWQINVAGLPKYSLCTVMRSFLLEHEISRGTKKLVYQGGTPHSMRFSFMTAESTDLLAVRRLSARAWALAKFSRWIFPEKNFLGAALREMTGEEPRESTVPPDATGSLSNAA
jgi:hypothetical protein